jgi:hypothetical protein
MNEKYPEELTCDEIDEIARVFERFDGNKSYKADYEDAKNYADEINGVVYTQVDGDDDETYYLKGFHYVNRIGYVVIKR